MSDRITTMIPHKLSKFDMTTEATNADLAFFTPTVKPLLGRFDSSEHYSPIKGGSMKVQLGAREMAFIANREWFYVAAMGQDGWPYTQRHRGPKGFLRVLGATSVGFASLTGRQRYISDGSALLFLIDHALHAQLKIWADAKVSEDPATMEKLMITRRGSPRKYVAFLFSVRAFDWGDEQHAIQRSAREVHSPEAARPGKSDPLSTNAMTAKRCLSLDASKGVWTLKSRTVGF